MAEPSCPLAVIVPVYRNADTLVELARRVRATLSTVAPGYRLLFVVDASPDGSWEVIRGITAGDPQTSGLLLERNVGQHRAVMAGLARVEAERYAILDADLQDPPELLAEMLELARGRGGTVFALREGRYQSWHRMITSRSFKWLLGRLTGLPVNAGTYLLLPREVAADMVRMATPAPQVVVMARHFSRIWSCLAYRRQLRGRGESAYSTANRIRAGWRSLQCALACRRLGASHQRAVRVSGRTTDA